MRGEKCDTLSLFLYLLGICKRFHSPLFWKGPKSKLHFHWIFIQHYEKCTCSFILHKHVKSNSPDRASICWGAFVLGHWGAAEGVQHDCPLVSRAWDEDIINGPVVLIQAIMSRLPPAEASSNLFSIRREKDIHESVRKWWWGWGESCQRSHVSKSNLQPCHIVSEDID